MNNDNIKYTIGIDEAGRGPIAGPVAVGGVIIRNDVEDVIEHELVTNFMRGKLKDSKKLSEKKREEIFAWMQEKQKDRELDFAVVMGSNKTIDEVGIVLTISKTLSKVLTKLMKSKLIEVGPLEDSVKVLLDGGLRAPEAFKHQKTIVRGDENEVTISLASIAAKVTRDVYMKKLGEKYNKIGKEYGFEQHKGYGTKGHYEALKKYNICEEHRESWIKS
jgi:ribonuclease HII